MDIRRNNFDLLRLFAALEVAYAHSFSHLEIKTPVLQLLNWLLSAFPGVPIFFMISGFLITASYERNHKIKQYAVNRLLRIYPALWVAFFLSVILIGCFGYLHFEVLGDFLVWAVCQLTVFQFYNPLFLRGLGVGVVNGALWTITVELQFYILVPIMYFFVKKYIDWNSRVKFFWVVFVTSIVVTLICNQVFGSDGTIGNHGVNTTYSIVLLKLLHVSILPYLYCFLIGVLLRFHLDKVQRFIVGKYKFLFFLLTYFALYAIFRESITFNTSNPLTMVLLALPVISFAFSFNYLSKSLLKDNDFSYGIYIYHMLVINIFVCFGLIGTWYFLPLVIMLATAISIFSWILIEKPALAYKYNPLRQVIEEKYTGLNTVEGQVG